MLTILGWLWKSPTCAVQYKPEHANIWARMIHKNLFMPHRFVLATDQPKAEFDPLITPIPLWDDWRNLKNPYWSERKPCCYVRLKAFGEEARELIGERFVSIDLDCLVTDSLDPLFNRPEDFLIYHRFSQTPRDERNTYQGSMWLMTAGARAQVWNTFRGGESVKAAAGYMGTDQAWIRYRLGPDEAGWGVKDGVYSWPNICTNANYRPAPPPGARIIFFNGSQKPWEFPSMEPPHCQNCGAETKVQPPYQISMLRGVQASTHPWIGRYYR